MFQILFQTIESLLQSYKVHNEIHKQICNVALITDWLHVKNFEI